VAITKCDVNPFRGSLGVRQMRTRSRRDTTKLTGASRDYMRTRLIAGFKEI